MVRTKDLATWHKGPVALFLDFDGTLAPLRNTPAMAALTDESRDILKEIAESPGIFLSIVTGRGMQDIKQKIGIENICYITSHGFEISSPRLDWWHREAYARRQKLIKLSESLSSSLRAFKGVFIEVKPFTLTIHYRLLKNANTADLKAKVREVIGQAGSGFRLTKGKKAIEIRPDLQWDKGMAVMAVLKGLNHTLDALPIYIGDDITDEDAFRNLRKTGITIKVGRGPTSAEFFVESTADVQKFLEDLNFLF